MMVLRSRARMLSACALALTAYYAGRRAGLVDGELRGTLHTGRALVEAAVQGSRA